ncbi:FAD-dependent monooxygenase [Flavobacterium sp. SUN046]|uniref:FAD-dependent monooxygenase n=1 Tax=Flavobacterium sp. SUN046 TaxID=3002440 RepID=UPI002DBDD2DD|nr:FAD-dependent monooxygenase [Flavobacterium sp. SUN046]MEC4048733.1 FAD-dependent monooxygenase [Flavobacterium sp. SUN046]
MKTISIIGGGIAGLTVANILHKEDMKFALYERSSLQSNKGHGFIIPSEGLEILKTYVNSTDLLNDGNILNEYISFDYKGNFIDKKQLQNDFIISRKALVDLLEKNIPREFIYHDKSVSYIQKSTDGILEVFFSDDTSIVPTSIVIAADGSKSKIRTTLISDKLLRETGVHEIVNIFENSELATILGNQFLKFHHTDGGLSIGLLKVSATEVLCYAQFDINRYPLKEDSTIEINNFMQTNFKDWAYPVSLFLEKTNFENAHYWRVNELDILDDYFSENTVFVGDTAHSLLPFTSQGVTSAIKDAQVLIDSLKRNPSDYKKAFKEYSTVRKEEIAIHFKNGRLLRDNFLLPLEEQKNNIIPISFK